MSLRLALICGFMLLASAAKAETMHRSGPAESRIDLVILAEGYSASERAEFEREAGLILRYMREKEPFATYLSLFNVHRGFRASPGSNIDRVGPERTAYGTKRKGSSTTITSTNLALIDADALAAGDEADYVLILCKGIVKGGAARGRQAWVADVGGFVGTAIHELGHMMGFLADEYINDAHADALVSAFQLRYDSPELPATILKYMGARPNASIERERSKLPWAAWVKASTPVPGRLDRDEVSAFEGAWYFRRGVYRPRISCAMTVAELGPFCEPCREALVARFHAESKANQVRVTDAGDALLLELDSAIANPEVSWSNGARGATLRLPKANLPSGSLSLSVTDPTPWVRRADAKVHLTERLSVTLPQIWTPASPWEPVTEEGRPGEVTATRLNMRSGPGTEHGVLTSLPGGSEVRVLETRDGWHRVRAGELEGWVSSKYIALGEEAPEPPAATPPPAPEPQVEVGVVTATRLNMRSGPGTGYEVLTSLPKGAELRLLGRRDGWIQVVAGGRLGWVSSRYVELRSVGMTGALRGE